MYAIGSLVYAIGSLVYAIGSFVYAIRAFVYATGIFPKPAVPDQQIEEKGSNRMKLLISVDFVLIRPETVDSVRAVAARIEIPPDRANSVDLVDFGQIAFRKRMHW